VQVFTLQFTSEASLLEGFRCTQDRSGVESCLLEIDQLRMRLIAPREEGERIAQRIYLDGGLRWCSGHAIQRS
jgi:hypothetical protein